MLSPFYFGQPQINLAVTNSTTQACILASRLFHLSSPESISPCIMQQFVNSRPRSLHWCNSLTLPRKLTRFSLNFPPTLSLIIRADSLNQLFALDRSFRSLSFEINQRRPPSTAVCVPQPTQRQLEISKGFPSHSIRPNC